MKRGGFQGVRKAKGYELGDRNLVTLERRWEEIVVGWRKGVERGLAGGKRCKSV